MRGGTINKRSAMRRPSDNNCRRKWRQCRRRERENERCLINIGRSENASGQRHLCHETDAGEGMSMKAIQNYCMLSAKMIMRQAVISHDGDDCAARRNVIAGGKEPGMTGRAPIKS